MTYHHNLRPRRFYPIWMFWVAIAVAALMAVLAVRNAQPMNCDHVRYEDNRTVCEVDV